MTLGDETIRYTPNAVSGSEALDLDHLVFYGYDGSTVQEPEYEELQEQSDAPETVPEQQTRRAAAPRPTFEEPEESPGQMSLFDETPENSPQD